MRVNDKDDLKYNEALKKKIAKLKKKRNAVIIVHNYQRDEIQDIADISGDSLALSQAAVRTDADVIVFCGVQFMAESASILNPDKTVLLPVIEAGCPLADMITAEKLRAKRKQYPNAAVVCYVNSSAEVKAESDIACTSSNAIQIVRSLKEKDIIFVPDRNLGRYVQSQVPEKNIILWEGFCPTHIRVQEEDIIKAKELHKGAEVLAHPECNPEVLAIADHVCSTAGMFTYAKKSTAKEFIIATESGMLYKLQKENPDKKFYLPTPHLVCANMKLITLGWVAYSLEKMVYEIKVSEEVRERARKTLDRMLAVSK
ncbi:MAG: quinolinate synthase NadA [Candidatus Omnitrophica bacterium]|nr:quinolinate synthase NadA [Candidatus Omnitrophota bacterium]MCM8790511.1 quinolinate synthase NadA [Candidatus Omnitrophota bacterium]